MEESFLLSLFATEEDIRQIFRTYTALFRLADGEERIWPTEDELNRATRFWAAGAILPQCMDPGSPEYDQWKETLPQCMKDSEQFLKWLESAPQGVPKNSPEYIKWIIENREEFGIDIRRKDLKNRTALDCVKSFIAVDLEVVDEALPEVKKLLENEYRKPTHKYNLRSRKRKRHSKDDESQPVANKYKVK